MMNFSYSCRCGWRSLDLTHAQQHADKTEHTVDVRGTITRREELVRQATAITEEARRKAVDSEVMRQARARGLR